MRPLSSAQREVLCGQIQLRAGHRQAFGRLQSYTCPELKSNFVQAMYGACGRGSHLQLDRWHSLSSGHIIAPPLSSDTAYIYRSFSACALLIPELNSFQTQGAQLMMRFLAIATVTGNPHRPGQHLPEKVSCVVYPLLSSRAHPAFLFTNNSSCFHV